MSYQPIDGFELSPSQRRLWLLGQEHPVLCVQGLVRISGPLRPDAFVAAIGRVVARHESLRTAFRRRPELRFPVQAVQAEPRFHYQSEDLAHLPAADQAAVIAGISNDTQCPDPEDGAPLSVWLLRVGPADWVWISRVPALCADAASLQNVVAEVCAGYGAPEALPAPDDLIQHAQFAQWQHNLLESPDEEALAFWEKYPYGIYKHVKLPLGETHPAPADKGPLATGLVLDPATTRALLDLSAQTGAPVAAVLLAGWHVFQYKHTAFTRGLVGQVVNGREYDELKTAVGLIAKTLPVVVELDDTLAFTEVIAQVVRVSRQVLDWQTYFSLERGEPTPGAPVFPVGFEYNAPAGIPAAPGLSFAWDRLSSHTDAFGLKLSCVQRDEALALDFHADPGAYTPAALGLLAAQFEALLRALAARPAGPIAQASLMSTGQVQQILREFNGAPVPFDEQTTLVARFEAQVCRSPGAVALSFEGQTLTYRELNEKANQLAHCLRARFGVQPDDLVGVLMGRSDWAVVAMLGVLKAGGAFVPIELSYPAERIGYIIENAAVKTILVDDPAAIGTYGLRAGDTVALRDEWDQVAAFGTHNPSPAGGARNLAYVIYTSGSTGRPKGVQIEHASFTNYLRWSNTHYFNDGRGKHFPLFTSLSFDLTLTSIFTTLLRGDQLFIYPDAEAGEVLTDIFTHPRISAVKLTPSHISLLAYLPIAETAVADIIVGGEALTRTQVYTLKKLNPAIRIYNEYGPTETTVGCTVKSIGDGEALISIGTPIANTVIYIVDEQLDLLPAGIAGELCIGGKGVARGYLNRPDLTAEKFVPNPFASDDGYDRLYRTGDVARWLPDGEIEYLGRKDQQVKIRGYRIELGEIETNLLKHPQIEEAAVVVKEDEPAGKHLVAYLKSQGELPVAAVREHLEQLLPAFMIPSVIVPLAAFPLTSNGKIDRKALAVLQQAPTPLVAYAPPENELEQLLADAWESVLGREGIGVDDDFFAAGGDSIKAIQIASRVYKAGYKVDIRDIFRCATIRRLAGAVRPAERVADQGSVEGVVLLTPIQQAFFESQAHPHHYNQSVMLYAGEGFAEEALRAVFGKLVQHHDALRMCYPRLNGQVVQVNEGTDQPLSLHVVDLRSAKDPKAALAVHADQLQAGIHLADGPLLKLGLFHLPDGDRLLIVAHHLVIDGVSWRILFEDIDALYRQYQRGEALSLPPKTDSFKTWAGQLRQYANGAAFLAEKPYWAALEAREVIGLIPDVPGASNLVKDTGHVSFRLTAAETTLLLTEVNRAFHTEINDILLTALAMSFRQEYGLEELVVDLEGHGREEILDKVDVSRTVGWFTSVYPVFLRLAGHASLADQIKAVKEVLHRVPNKGIGYGVLKYLTDPAHKGGIAFGLKPQVGFNYLGQFDADVAQTAFGIASEPTGNALHGEGKRLHDFEVSGLVAGGRLEITLDYSQKRYRAATVARLRDSFAAALRDIIAFCTAREEEFTPSDFVYKELSLADLEDFFNEY